MRRSVIGCLVALLVLAYAQPARADRTYRVGILEVVSPAMNAANFAAFKEGLRDLGYVEGRNLVIDYRSADGHPERFPVLAAELAKAKPDVIVARTTVAVTSARAAAPATPIVMAATGDPVATGLAASLARPGGMVTGLTSLSAAVSAKRLQLVKEAFPSIQRVGNLIDTGTGLTTQWKILEQSARGVGLTPLLFDVRKTADLAPAFDAAVKQRADALVVGGGTVLQTNLGRVVELAAKHRLPAVYNNAEFVDRGGLMAYAVSFPPLYRRAATYVDRLLKGANPAELPIEQPTQFELVVNVRTARALGLTLPQSLLLRADRIVE